MKYLKQFNIPFEIIIKDYHKEFTNIYDEEKEWLCNIEDKLHLLKNETNETIIREVIQKLKKGQTFNKEDKSNLSIFVSKINTIVRIANRINNFKEGVVLDNGSKLSLPDFFNLVSSTNNFSSFNYLLNNNLKNFLPHLFSVIKHCQAPSKYPIYYKYWKNIIREVLAKDDSYDSITNFYREFPLDNRHLNFGSYLGTIGLEVANNFNQAIDSKLYKYLKKNVLNLPKFSAILDKKNDIINMKEKFKQYLTKNNKKGSQKASSYIRSLELLDTILNSKAKNKLEGFKSIYNITSTEIISKLHLFILEEQKKDKGIFENEEPISYWRDRFYSAAIKSYLDFLKSINMNDNPNTESQTDFSTSRFHQDCTTANLKYSNQLVTRYISSLVTKPFVLLSGLSGSGKTKLAQSFAQWICNDKNQYCIVPVGADWTNREPLLGYVNALDKSHYIVPENGVLRLLIEANKKENENKPYFLILDEMNLSHVERYFADFLSVMETRKEERFKLHSDKDNEKSGVPHELSWPKNLFVVGTVNIDETTYMFSPKVLDRANVIEFRVNETEIKDFLNAGKEITSIKKMGAAMGNSFVDIARNNKNEGDFSKLNNELLGFFKELQLLGAEFGYRTASEIQTLFSKIDLVNPAYSDKENEKIDIAIMQKLLPKLHGSRRKLLKTLNLLAQKCLAKEQEIIFNERGVYTISEDNEIKYNLSFEKIARMYKNAIENGFASYAEA